MLYDLLGGGGLGRVLGRFVLLDLTLSPVTRCHLMPCDVYSTDVVGSALLVIAALQIADSCPVGKREL